MNKIVCESLSSTQLASTSSIHIGGYKEIIKNILISTCALLLSACGSLPDLGLSSSTKATETMKPQEIILEPTIAAPLEENVLPEVTTLPEATPTSDTVFFRDEFDKGFNEGWDLHVVSGLKSQLEILQENSELHLKTYPPNDVNFIFMNKKHNYKDVIVQAEVYNSGPLDNAFSLICRASESGWYEFRISSSYYYELLRYDFYKQGDGSNAYTNLLYNRIGSSLIKNGANKNVFSLSCVGNQITFYINGIQPYRGKRPVIIEDTTYTDGTIGFGFAGYGKTLDAAFDWVETVKP